MRQRTFTEVVAKDAGVQLLVLLASPPLTSGQRTRDRLAALPAVIPNVEVLTANLFAWPTRDLPSMTTAASAIEGWTSARGPIQEGLLACDCLMAAWGMLRLSGPARLHRDAQLRWLVDTAQAAGHRSIWTVGGQARHPSRWHQYVSDRYARTSGGTFPIRLGQVLVEVPLTELA